MRHLIIIMVALLAMECNVAAKDAATAVIFDTDMGNDIDDALALDLLYKYQDMGRIKLLGIMSSKKERESAQYIDVMSTWYGYRKTPIGIARDGVKGELATNYATKVVGMKVAGKPLLKRSVKDVGKLPDAHKLYRKLLASQPDNSVVIICTGFATNLGNLLSSAGDSYSPLNGRDLISRKVKQIVLMAGRFDNTGEAEYNVVNDIASCAKLFAESPVPVVTSPFELGLRVLFPGECIEKDFGWTALHPLVLGYKAFLKMPYDRPTWDLTAVLHVLEPGRFMSCTEPGRIDVDEKGRTSYTPARDGKHSYLTATDEQRREMAEFFVEIISKKPKKFRIKD